MVVVHSWVLYISYPYMTMVGGYSVEQIGGRIFDLGERHCC